MYTSQRAFLFLPGARLPCVRALLGELLATLKLSRAMQRAIVRSLSGMGSKCLRQVHASRTVCSIAWLVGASSRIVGPSAARSLLTTSSTRTTGRSSS
jgi:hypothetical protein